MIGCLVLSLGAIGLFSQPWPEFSLDDHPSNVLVMPFGPWSGGGGLVPTPPFASAEDEFGLGLPAALAFFIGPSPSLLPVQPPGQPPRPGPFIDSDVLMAGPVLLITFPPPPYYMDAISTNNAPMDTCDTIFVEFSVDRATGGATPADASWNQAFWNEQPGDIYRVDNPGFMHLRLLVPLPPPVVPPWTFYYGGPIGPAGQGGNNWLLYDHAGYFNLLPNRAPYPVITPGSHDNIDAYNRWLFSLLDVGNTAIYFCLHPASVVNLTPTLPPPPPPLSAADIYFCANPPGGTFWPPTGRYAWANQMGLDTFGKNTDSIDGVAVFDVGVPGVCEPGLDYAGFTLAPGSATLTALVNAGYAVNAASIFMTDFQGFFYTYLFDTDIGVGNGPIPPLPGVPYVDINVDALELTIDPPPLPYINPVTRPVIDPVTKK
jgi:hypothetical protein